MKIGILGAGMVGRAVAAAAVRSGYEVMLSNSRSPDTLFTIRKSIGCLAGTALEAAQFGDIVLVAVPLKNYADVPVDATAGKVVLDANNYYPERDGAIPPLDRKETTTSELLAAHLPTSHVVKAFNAIMATDIEVPGDKRVGNQKRALPLAADDADAKKVTAELYQALGFDVVDAGALAEGWRFEEGTPAYCVPMTAETLRATLASTNR